MPIRTYEYVRKLLSLRSLLGGKCTRTLPRPCPRSSRLEFVHLGETKLNGRGRGARQRYLDILRHPTMYGLACRTCHRRLDSGGLGVGSVPSIAAVAAAKGMELPRVIGRKDREKEEP